MHFGGIYMKEKETREEFYNNINIMPPALFNEYFSNLKNKIFLS